MNIYGELNQMTEHAKKYSKEAQKSIQKNNHMNDVDEGELVQERHINATLVDFINYIAMKNGVDYALFTDDLK